MASRYGRAAGAVSIGVVLALTAAGCGDDDSGGDSDKSTPTAIASALESAGEEAREAVSSASASAAAKLDEIKDGVDAKADASVGPTAVDGDRTTAEVTVVNGTDNSADYTLTVNFRDAAGNVLDIVVVDVDQVGAGKQTTTTARSHRTLSGPTTADIGRVIRH
ncbi:hypothetical protein [Embleya sp. NBC_00896]|uniref:hypothetical protein n=1 Tax=Embleya sp. NBC_00896 TaxID=2975961 RepID=UPI00386BD2F4|nr:hypothetical protein OG928_06245 [Embleya sp. NBC_00896]